MKYYLSLLVVVVVAVAGCKGPCISGQCEPYCQDQCCEPSCTEQCGEPGCQDQCCEQCCCTEQCCGGDGCCGQCGGRGCCNGRGCLGKGHAGLFARNLPPATMLMHPGPGVDGPGPGVMSVAPAVMGPPQTSQVAFVGPDGTQVRWDVSMPGQFDSDPLVCPGRYNFQQSAIYRLKLTNIPSRPGVELYPTLEVGPAAPRTAAFLSHNAIPAQFTEEDFDQVLSGNFVTKVIYLPDPEFQELASAGIETLVSTRLDPGVDPIAEADRRGAILAVIRLGNKDLEMPGDAGNGDQVMPASYGAEVAGEMPAGEMDEAIGAPMGMPVGNGWSTVPQPYISGVTGPPYGMTTCGTPIGLPGPPHIPLGIPAGLKKHVVQNHTRVNVPKPTKKVRIDVKQIPGMSYPRPASRALIIERARAGAAAPSGGRVRHEVIMPGCPDEACPVMYDDGAPYEGEPCEDCPNVNGG